MAVSAQLHIIKSAIISLVEHARLAHTLQCAVTALAGQSVLLQMAFQSAAEVPGARTVFEELLKRQESLGPWAREVEQNRNHEINLPGIINIWITLEASIEDLCISIIMEDPESLVRLKSRNNEIGNDPVTTEEDARKVYEKALLRLKKHGLVSALFDILALLGVKPPVRDVTKDHLKELNYVRNCALHRNGIVEARKNIEAPTLPFSVGHKLTIANDFFLRCYDAASDLLSALHSEFEC